MLLNNFIYHALWVLPVANAAGKKTAVPLLVTNKCRDTIWPGLFTSNGTGPESLGFELTTESTRNLSVLSDWNGRIWGRTNCTFDDKGLGSCGTGNCGGKLECSITGEAATLAEFNLEAFQNQSYYDISLVDGYNLPVAIQVIRTNGIPVPPANQSNPICIGSLQGFSPSKSFNPYVNSKSVFFGTNASAPLPFESKMTYEDVSHWCPWDLQFHPMEEVGNTRLPFDPCLSLCSKTKKAEYCCTGKHDSAKTCSPNYYSKRAKQVCPDAYSYAYDDATSTFTMPTGTGFEIIFCPEGRSTVIKKVLAGGVSGAGSVSASWLAPWTGVLVAVWFA